MRRICAALALAAVAVACSDQPTAVDEVGSPQFVNTHNLEQRGYRLDQVYSVPESDPWPGPYISCFNGGQGEWTTNWGGPYESWLSTPVSAPSGQGHVRQYFLLQPGGYDYLRGEVTGDFWAASEFVALEPFHYYPDGTFRMLGAISVIYTNQQTAERVWMKFSYNVTFDADWNIIDGVERISPVACRALH